MAEYDQVINGSISYVASTDYDPQSGFEFRAQVVNKEHEDIQQHSGNQIPLHFSGYEGQHDQDPSSEWSYTHSLDPLMGDERDISSTDNDSTRAYYLDCLGLAYQQQCLKGDVAVDIQSDQPHCEAHPHLSQGEIYLAAPEGGVEGSYAQLIYKALMSVPKHGMKLEEIYEWFEKNTQKTSQTNSKGWQNSVRHNLSMIEVGVSNNISTLSNEWTGLPEGVFGRV